jgi:hypothetical protein
MAGVIGNAVGYGNTMLIAGIIALCVVILILAFLFPRFSQRPQQGSQKVIGAGGREASKAPGRLGRWLSKPFSKSNKAVAKSGSAGRRSRSKLPF